MYLMKHNKMHLGRPKEGRGAGREGGGVMQRNVHQRNFN